MARFDAAAFAAGLVDPIREAVKPIIADAGKDAGSIVRELDAFESDVDATIDAMNGEVDAGRLRVLHDDLEKFLPARKDAILALVATKLASDAQAVAEVALTIAVKAAIIAAKAFVPL